MSGSWRGPQGVRGDCDAKADAAVRVAAMHCKTNADVKDAKAEAAVRLAAKRALGELGWEGHMTCAVRFFDRLCGFTVLAPVTEMGELRILVFPCCHAVHTCFMSFPLDIAFISPDGYVLKQYRAVGSGRFFNCPSASFVCERPALQIITQ